MFLFAVYIIGIFIAFGLLVLKLRPSSLAETIVLEVESLLWPAAFLIYLCIVVYEAFACYKE